MPWALCWPLDSDYAVKLAKDLNLIKRPNPRESEYFVAGANHIVTQARSEHVLNCWVDGSIDLVFGLYVDDRARQHRPKRIVMSRMTPLSKWYNRSINVDHGYPCLWSHTRYIATTIAHIPTD
ncbi:hypothetical protein DAEQUDRAFT_526596 [Daedalea quercina L-15889]|uniref:Uncharacterized protein n=1 Tax=Daedalea quercina L-15889 TaxID=1314783 RepID=A0A165M9G5_9APHY|nr:hypothetical protein DAEQUDRAFT_526596 [Daedalea quercina L-15889]